MNLRSIFTGAIIEEKGKMAHAVFQYFIMRNIAQNSGRSCRALVYPFENQAWEKMTIAALRDSGARARILACHHISLPFLYLNFFLGREERDVHPQPDLIMVNGKYYESVFRRSAFACAIRNGGSPRPSVKNQGSKESNPDTRDDRNVLVLLSSSLEYSLDLLFYLRKNPSGGKIFLIKPHPDVPEAVIRKSLGRLPENFHFISGGMGECMARAAWAIHIGTTAAVECLQAGLRVFKYLSERIDLDPLLQMGFPQCVVTDENVLDFRNRSGSDIPKDFLAAEPFNEEAWRETLLS